MRWVIYKKARFIWIMILVSKKPKRLIPTSSEGLPAAASQHDSITWYNGPSVLPQGFLPLLIKVTNIITGAHVCVLI